MLTFKQFSENYYTSSKFDGPLLQKGDQNPHKLPWLNDTKQIKDESWAQMFRKKYNVIQRKFKADFPDYSIKRKDDPITKGVARWAGQVLFKGTPIGSFYFIVEQRERFPKPVAYIAWIGKYAPGEDWRGEQAVDWNHEVEEHKGVMTGVVKLWIDAIQHDISCVALDDGSGGYWHHFFNKYFPSLTVFDV